MGNSSLYLGAPGSGKTYNLLKIYESAYQLWNPIQYYIVPTLEHVKRLEEVFKLNFKPQGLLGYAGGICTFDKLAKKLLIDNHRLPYRLVSELEKCLLIQKIISQGNWNKLHEEHYSWNLIRQVMELISFWKRQLPELATNHQLLVDLLADLPYSIDLAKIFAEYQKLLEANQLIDDQDLLRLLSESVDFSGFTFFLDGFFELSHLQKKVISKWSNEANVYTSLCWRPDFADNPCFEQINETRTFFKSLHFKELTIQGNHRQKTPSLKLLTDKLFQSNIQTSTTLATDLSILQIQASDNTEQIRLVAKTILQLRQNQENNWSDITLVVKDLPSYQLSLEQIFNEYHIPLNIHLGIPLQNNLLIQFLLRLLTLYDQGLSQQDFLAWAQSPFLNSSPEEFNQLSMLIKNIGSELVFLPELQAKGNPLLMKLKSYQLRIQKSTSLKILQENLELLCQNLIYWPTVWENSAYNQAWQKYQKLLSEYTLFPIWKESKPNFSLLVKLLADLMKNTLYKNQEPPANVVQVYDIYLIQQKEYQFVFVLDLVQGKFPNNPQNIPLLSNTTGRTLSQYFQKNLELNSSFKDYFLFYTACTRAIKGLYLCSYDKDEEGQLLKPSIFLDYLAKLFPKIPQINSSYLKKQFLSKAELFSEVLPYLAQLPSNQERTSIYNNLIMLYPEDLAIIWQKNLFAPEAKLSGALQSKIYSLTKEISISAIEDYRSCPYRFFLQQVLKLEANDTGYDSRQTGSILHRILEIFFNKLAGRKPKLGDQLYLEQLLDNSLANNQMLLKETPLLQKTYFLELKQLLTQFLKTEVVYQEKSQLINTHNELKLRYNLDDQTVITVKLDRIDLLDNNCLIIDYKLGSKETIKDLQNLNSLQLLFYSIVLTEQYNYQMIGLEYYSLKQSSKKGLYIKENWPNYLSYPSRQSQISQEDFTRLLAEAKNQISLTLDSIRQGKLTFPKDNTECPTYCNFQSICRFS